jgi:hypothetical protein
MKGSRPSILSDCRSIEHCNTRATWKSYLLIEICNQDCRNNSLSIAHGCTCIDPGSRGTQLFVIMAGFNCCNMKRLRMAAVVMTLVCMTTSGALRGVSATKFCQRVIQPLGYDCTEFTVRTLLYLLTAE